MARSASSLWPTHYLLQPLRPAKGRNMGPDHALSCRRSRWSRPNDRHVHRARASARCLRCQKQKPSDGSFTRRIDQQIHAVVDTNGLPVRLGLTAGEAHDNRLALSLLSRLRSGSMLLADRGYDADWIRAFATERGSWANVPPRCNRREPICFSPHLYRARNLVERFFNKITQCRRVATRYDKLTANYLAFIQLASIRLWLRAL